MVTILLLSAYILLPVGLILTYVSTHMTIVLNQKCTMDDVTLVHD